MALEGAAPAASAIVAGANPLAAGAVIGSQLLSNGINFLTAQYNAKQQYKYQSKLIDKMNEYNSPKSIIQRYADAGINPMFAFTNGAEGQQSVAGATDAPQTTDFQLAAAVAQAKQFALQERELDIQQQNADTKRMEAETGKNVGESVIELNSAKTLTEWYQQLGIQSNIDLNRYRADLFDAQTQHELAQVNYTEMSTLAKEVGIYFDLDTWDARKQDILSAVALKYAQRSNIFMEDGTVNAATFKENVRQFQALMTVNYDLDARRIEQDDEHFYANLNQARILSQKDRRAKLLSTALSVLGGAAGFLGSKMLVGGISKAVAPTLITPPHTISQAEFDKFNDIIQKTRLY